MHTIAPRASRSTIARAASRTHQKTPSALTAWWRRQWSSSVSSNGSSVVVWTEAKSSTDTDVKAQRYDALGHKVGGEVVVATGRNPQHNPSVAMDGSGGFVVVPAILGGE